MKLIQAKISDIRVKNRVRSELGDIDRLVASIEDIGLLQPVVINSDSRLLAGWRRVEAFKRLERERIPAAVVESFDEALQILKAERDENTCREPFKPSEAVEIGQSLEALEKPKAKARQAAAGPKSGKGKKTGRGKLPQPVNGKTRDKVAAAVGLSGKTYEKAAAVVKASESEKGMEDLVALMDKKSVDAAYREMNKRRKAKELAAAAAKVSRKAKAKLSDVCVLKKCDFRELLADSKPDSVITDPPYPEEYLPLFGELAKACVGVPLVAVMCGQTYLPRILQAMCEHLAYRWTLAYLTPGGQAVQQWNAKVNAFWKPVLLFGDASEWIGDVSQSKTNDNDKRFHGWGQSESGMGDLIDRLTKPGSLVCDPFLGGGTTAIACLKLGRRFVGCDIDGDAVKKTTERCLALVSSEDV